MRASSSSRAVAPSRQQSQRTTRRTPSTVTDFHPVSSQRSQAMRTTHCSTETRRRQRHEEHEGHKDHENKSVVFVIFVTLVILVSLPSARLGRIIWLFDGDGRLRGANEVGRGGLHERGRQTLFPVAEAARQFV